MKKKNCHYIEFQLNIYKHICRVEHLYIYLNQGRINILVRHFWKTFQPFCQLMCAIYLCIKLSQTLSIHFESGLSQTKYMSCECAIYSSVLSQTQHTILARWVRLCPCTMQYANVLSQTLYTLSSDNQPLPTSMHYAVCKCAESDIVHALCECAE